MGSELNGLRQIISSDPTKMHSIAPPPEDATDEQYRLWWLRTHCWHATFTPVLEGPADD